jgi:hypothetical protein
MSRRYYSRMNGGQNTCSIRSLKKAYIGSGVRMTSDKSTKEFENLPMKGMIIEDYNKLGFHINHPNFPKSVWVNFDQLPLTRLTMKNGVIEDEITFVENIVNHQMQLIRTLDTEYIDMIYKEKSLDQKQDEIIPISQAVPGQIYIGAQCEEGNEMIFIGTFFVKELKTVSNFYAYYNRSGSDKTKYYMHKLSPQRAFFAIPAEEVTQAEENALIVKYYGKSENRWSKSWEEREVIDKKIREEKKQILANSPVPRFKILDFAITSKRIKQLIITNKENKAFANADLNKDAIIASQCSNSLNNQLRVTPVEYPNVNFIISNSWYGPGYYMSKSKETIENETREFYKNYRGVELEECVYEDRYKK